MCQSCIESIWFLSVFPGCRGTLYQTADPRRSFGLTSPSKPCPTSPVSFHNTFPKIFSFRHIFRAILLRRPPCFVCVVWRSAVARGGHSGGSTAGMRGLISSVKFCKCPPYTSITEQLRSLYSHQFLGRSLLRSSHCVGGSEKKTPLASC